MDTASQAVPALPRHPRLPQILELNWQAEMAGHYTYRTLAEREPEPGRKQTLEHMAQAEKDHAALWAGRLKELGAPDPVYRGKTGGDADSFKTRVGGDDLALRRLEIDESRDIARYSQQLKELGDAPSVAILDRVIEDEQQHYRELSSLIRRFPPRGPARFRGQSKSASGTAAVQAQPGPFEHSRVDWGRYLWSQRRPWFHFRHCLGSLGRDPGQ